MRNGSLAAALVGSVLLLAACSEDSQKRIAEEAISRESGGKVKADLSSGKVHIKDEKGETTFAAGGSVEIPKEFPKDVLVYPGATVIVASKQGDVISLVLQTSDEPKKVVSTYGTDLKAKGWKEESSLSVAGGSVVQFKKGERTVTLSVTRADGKTQIALQAERAE